MVRLSNSSVDSGTDEQTVCELSKELRGDRMLDDRASRWQPADGPKSCVLEIVVIAAPMVLNHEENTRVMESKRSLAIAMVIDLL